jgi:hypothetical protein
MNLQDLRPRAGANLDALAPILHRRDWRSLLPSALSEDLLLALARDFRNVEGAMCGPLARELEIEGLSVALCVVLHLLAEHPERSNIPDPVNASWQELTGAIQLYQWELEREVVSRVVGLPASNAGEQLLAGLRESVGRTNGPKRKSRRGG